MAVASNGSDNDYGVIPMNGAQFDCSRENRHAHENAPVPIRVRAIAFRKFQAEMEEYWSRVVAEHGTARSLRYERRRLRSRDQAQGPENPLINS